MNGTFSSLATESGTVGLEQGKTGLSGAASWRARFRHVVLLTLLLTAAVSSQGGPDGPPEPAPSGEQQQADLAVHATPQGLILRWFGEAGVPFQVETSADLATWTEAGPIIVGTNAWVSVTLATNADQSVTYEAEGGLVVPVTAFPEIATVRFFRLKDLGAAALDEEKDSDGDPRLAAVSAIFASANGGVLSITGDGLNNQITVSRNAAGLLLVNGGAVTIVGDTPTVANTRLIQVFGQGGNDTISLDEANGALPQAILFGGSGNDIVTGGSSSDFLFGQAGNDTLFGRGGSDFLFGGTESDVLTGGDANDLVFGEGGDDRFVWNPGDDTDLNEGGAGADKVEVNGGGGAETFTTTANGTRVRFDRINPAPFSIDIGSCEDLILNANGGDDAFSATGNLAALIRITVDGGAGNDNILGSNGIDLLRGGAGDDFIDGQQGNDVVFMGAGDDVFQWDPGDGSDTVEGEEDDDRLVFNGSAGSEIFTSSANGARVRFTRNLGNIVMDLGGLEKIELRALAGGDTVTVNHLGGTDVTEFNVLLAGALDGSAPDAQADVVIVNGTNAEDIIEVLGSGTSYSVIGLQPVVSVRQSSGADDSLVINALGGNDGVTAATLPAGVVKLTFDGGAGDDTLFGSNGADVFLGGDGNDFIIGGPGNDLALMGAHDDTFQWDPGDGSDILEGQDGTDSLIFFGSNANENINIMANGGRVLLLRDVASVTMDLDNVERIVCRALGGADNAVIGDLTGTDVKQVTLDLRGPDGAGDDHADSITVNGTQGADTFGAAGDAGGVFVFGLTARVEISHQEQARDRLTLNGLGGDDVIDATSLEADGIQLTINGGIGADILLGGEGDDIVNGGDGDDVALLNTGDDTFVWNPGDDDDTVEGQGGLDTLLFNGSNVGENINILRNGGRVHFLRDVANVLMDLNDVEQIEFNALGGADTIVVNDIAGTDVTRLHFNLAAVSGAGDAQPDSVILVGSAANETVLVSGSPTSGVQVFGLPAQIAIRGSEAANDRLTINLLAGDDVMEASGLEAGVIGLTGNGGEDDDLLTGSDGPDVLLGGPGDDVLLGGLGIDILDGGPGDNVVIQ